MRDLSLLFSARRPWARAPRVLVLAILALCVNWASPAWAQNLLDNPEFDTDTDGWQFLGPGGLDTLEWSARDWREPAEQGSAKLIHSGAAGLFADLYQCVQVPANATLLRFGVWTDYPPDQAPALGGATPFLRFRQGADCLGPVLGATNQPQPRGLPVNRPWVWYESTFDVPPEAATVETRLGILKSSGTGSEHLVAFYDGVVVEPVLSVRDLRVLVTLRGQVDGIVDQDGVLDPSIVVGAPLVVDIAYDEAASSGTSTFTLDIPPGFANLRIGESVFSSTPGTLLRASALDGMDEDQLMFTLNPPFAAPSNVNVTVVSIALVDDSASVLSPPAWLRHLALAELFDDSRTFSLIGNAAAPLWGGIHITGTFDDVRVRFVSEFADDFESGDTTRWSTSVP